jgi:hypothetical protein
LKCHAAVLKCHAAVLKCHAAVLKCCVAVLKNKKDIKQINYIQMKKINKLFLILILVLPFVLMSCGNSVANQLREETQNLKRQLPQYQGNGLTMTDANFYENEKVLEYIGSIEGVEYLDSYTVGAMKENIIDVFNNDGSAFEKMSVETIMKIYGYRFRYIYTDTEGNNLCTIEITKDDLR